MVYRSRHDQPDNVLEDVRRITERVDTPLLVDIDTGWGGAFNIAQHKQMIAAGAAAVAYRRSGCTKALWSSSE